MTGGRRSGDVVAPSRHRSWFLIGGLALAFVVTIALTLTSNLEFGSSAGGFVNGYIRRLHPSALLAFALVAPLMLLTVHLALKHLVRHEALSVASIVVVGASSQFVIRRLAPSSMDRITKDGSFFDVARTHGAAAYLRDYVKIAPNLPTHARANMPGKVLLLDLLQNVTSSRQGIGILLALLSSLAAVPAYALARTLFRSRRAGLYAMVLYLILPSRLYFIPIVNTVTPLLAFSFVLVLVQWLRTWRRWLLVALGLLLYVTLLFEPTPLIVVVLLGGLFLVGGADLGRRLRRREMLLLIGGPLLTFFVVHGIMTWLFEFDIFAAFNHIRRDAAAFNRTSQRGYLDFVVANVRDFVVTSGVLLSLLALGCCATAVRRWRSLMLRRETLSPLGALAVAVVASLLILDFSGVSRGEVARLWIFLGGFIVIVAAQVCALEAGSRFFQLIVAGTILQTCLTISRVDFAIVGNYSVPGFQGVPPPAFSPLLEVALLAAVVLVSLGLRPHVGLGGSGEPANPDPLTDHARGRAVDHPSGSSGGGPSRGCP